MQTFLSICTTIGVLVGTIIILPFIYFWFAYLGGWICSLTIGNQLADGLNTLFNTTHFTKDMIPLCAATLGWIGGYFKSKISANN